MRRFGWLLVATILVCVVSARAQMLQLIPNYVRHAGGGAAITFDNATFVGDNGNSGNFSHAYTGSTLTHGLLVVCITADGGDSVTGVTYNGVSATRAASVAAAGALRTNYIYYLLNPASGSNTLAVTQTGGDFLIVVAAEYAGVKQSAQPDATATFANQAVPTSQSITIANANSWAMSCTQTTGTNQSATGAINTARAHDTTNNNPWFMDSNGGLSTGAQSSSFTNPSVINESGVLASFQPG